MKPNKVIQPIKKPIKRVSNWCSQLWDGFSGKDTRRLKQLQHRLTLSRENEANLTQQLEESTQQYAQLQHALDHQQSLLASSQQALAASQRECQELWQELDELDAFVTKSHLQIQSLKTELENRTSALANCEANLGVLQQSKSVEASSPITANLPAETPGANLAKWKIGFVGGHDATRRVVTRTLHADHGLIHPPVEIPPHHDAKTSQKQLKDKLAECDLVVSIIGYSSHTLTKSLSQLKDKGALKASILIPNSRGVSGVVRDILSFVNANPDLV
ncbi:MAG: hypothetical protein AAF821_20630 [Cyanobacteria bacterium P01_D01_bin.156]